MEVPSPEGDEKNSILNKYFRARYIETQIRYIFNCKQYHKKVLVSSFLLRSHTNPLTKNFELNYTV